MGSQNVIGDSIRQFRVYRIGLVDRIPWGVTAYACKPGYASVSVKLYFTDEDSGTIQLIDSDSQGVRILNPPPPTPTPTPVPPTPTPTPVPPTPTPTPTNTPTPTPTNTPTATPLPDPPKVTGVTATNAPPEYGNFRVSLGWDYINGISRYLVESGPSANGPWTDFLPISPTQPPDSRSAGTGGIYGALCGWNYYQVSAYGDGFTYARTFGPASMDEARVYFDCATPTPTPTPSPTPCPNDVCPTPTNTPTPTPTPTPDPCGGNSCPPPPPPPPDCGTDFGMVTETTGFQREVRCDFFERHATAFLFQVGPGWHVTAELVIPEGTQSDVKLVIRKINDFSFDPTIVDSETDYLASFLGLPETDNSRVFQTVSALEHGPHKVVVEISEPNTSRSGIVRLYGEKEIPRRAHQADHTLQFIFERGDNYFLPASSQAEESNNVSRTTSNSHVRPRNTDPNEIFPLALSDAVAAWNRVIATPWPYVLVCKRPQGGVSSGGQTQCGDGEEEDGRSIEIATRNGEVPGDAGSGPRGRTEEFGNDVDCARDVGCVHPRGLALVHNDDPRLIIEQPAWLFRSFFVDQGQRRKSKHVQFIWTSDPQLDGLPIGADMMYRYLPATLMHELGHPIGLVDLYNEEGDYAGYIMDSSYGVTAIPELDVKYVRQVYRDAHPVPHEY